MRRNDGLFWSSFQGYGGSQVNGRCDPDSKHAVVGLTKNSAVMYGPKGLRFDAVAPGTTIANIVATWGSQLAAERLG